MNQLINTYKIKHNNEIKVIKIEEIINLIKENRNDNFYKFDINDALIEINKEIALNTLFICHRINQVDDLKFIDKQFGIEVDIREDQRTGKLKLAHDPFDNGYFFENYLNSYDKKILILNIKSERIEIDCLNLIKKCNITNYFFLDSSFPMIYLLNKKHNNNNIAMRYSEYEPINFDNIDMYKWIWIDCFNEYPINNKIFKEIKKYNKKICLVSPELQNHSDFTKFRNHILKENIIPDAICCKHYNIINWL